MTSQLLQQYPWLVPAAVILGVPGAMLLWKAVKGIGRVILAFILCGLVALAAWWLMNIVQGGSLVP